MRIQSDEKTQGYNRNTKEYLAQGYRIDQKINSKLEQIISLRELAAKATATLSNTPFSGTRKIHSMEGIIAKLLDLEKEINGDIDLLVDLKKEIMDNIKTINNSDEKIVLELRYLCFKTWEQIADQMGYSVQNAYKVHDRAVGNIKLEKV